MSNDDRLALEGGPRAVTAPNVDHYPQLTEAEIAAVVDCMRKGAISIGDGSGVIGELERDFAKMVGARYALAQNNGTSCLHSAFFAAGVGFGDEVIVPSYTWHASISPIMHCGGTPIFCDIDPRTHTADPRDIERKITQRTKAVAVTHVYGNIAEMDAIMEVANAHNLIVIEDASHAHGGKYDGKPVGSIGQIGCFSLQGSKPVTGGEAGIITTNDTELYERILILGHYGRIQQGLVTDKYRDLHQIGLGLKYRAHPLACAMANVQLQRLPELNARRRKCFAVLDEGLSKIPGIHPVEVLPKAERGGLLAYTATVDPETVGCSVFAFLTALAAEGVSTSPTITPYGYGRMHLEPVFNDFPFEGLGGPWGSPGGDHRKPNAPGSLPVSERVAATVFWFPPFADPEPGLLEQYIAATAKVVRHAGRLPALVKDPEAPLTLETRRMAARTPRS
jgi:dTDP-4-amino-4,6-dideoxygalactose transaminase